MDTLEELLPGIDKYLTEILSKEKLSVIAERQRKYYVERLVVLQLGSAPAPNPAENGGNSSPRVQRELPVPGIPVRSSRSNDDFIAQQRILSRQTDYNHQAPNNGEGADSDQYEDALYEEPVDNRKQESDIGSSTSYECYDEYDDSYMNSGTQEKSKPDIRLPSVRGKRKKKKASSTHIKDKLYTQLETVSHEGDIYHRGKIAFTSGWTKRYCVISNLILYLYKDKESKPITSIVLAGYDAVPIEEKEKGRTNVLRLSRPGSETHFLSTDSPIEKQTWLNKIEAACAQAESQAEPSEGPSQPQYHTSSSSVETAYVDFPGSVSPSINGARRKVAGTLSSDSGGKEKKKGIGKFFSDTFGRRKGAKLGQLISEGAVSDGRTLVSPEGAIGGIVNITSDTYFEPETGWQYKYCVIKNSLFECYKDDSTSSDLEFSMALNECVIQTSATDHERDLCLSISHKSGEPSFTFEPINKLEHGDWLSVLIKHIGGGSSNASRQNSDQQPTHELCSEEDLDYTYVETVNNSDRLLNALSQQKRPAISQPVPSTAADNEVEQQYADLSAPESNSDNEEGPYDQPPEESALQDSKMYLYADNSNLYGSASNVYEEISTSVLEPVRTISTASDPSNRTSNSSDQSNEAQSTPPTNHLQPINNVQSLPSVESCHNLSSQTDELDYMVVIPDSRKQILSIPFVDNELSTGLPAKLTDLCEGYAQLENMDHLKSANKPSVQDSGCCTVTTSSYDACQSASPENQPQKLDAFQMKTDGKAKHDSDQSECSTIVQYPDVNVTDIKVNVELSPIYDYTKFTKTRPLALSSQSSEDESSNLPKNTSLSTIGFRHPIVQSASNQYAEGENSNAPREKKNIQRETETKEKRNDLLPQIVDADLFKPSVDFTSVSSITGTENKPEPSSKMDSHLTSQSELKLVGPSKNSENSELSANSSPVSSRQSGSPRTESPVLDKKLSPRITRKDAPTKSSLVSKSNSPSGSDAGRSFSRDSSCSSESGRRASGSIAKNRAMFENNSTQLATSGGIWTGFQLAGAAPVKKTAVTLPAGMSGKVGVSKANFINTNKTSKTLPNNNRVTGKTIGTVPGKQNSPHSSLSGPSQNITQRTISPIRVTQARERTTTRQLANQKTDSTKSTNQVPATFQTLFEAPIKTSDGAKDANISQIRFEVSSSDLKIVSINPSDSSTRKPTVDITASTTTSRKTSITTDINANITKTQAKNNISNALNKLTRTEFQPPTSSPTRIQVTTTSIPSFKSPTEEQDERRLSELRTKLTQLRQDRQKLRDEKLRTLIPDDLEKLDVQYKAVDSLYKTTSREIKELEERKVERIKDPSDEEASIEARKQVMLENQRKSDANLMNSRRKM